MSYDEFLEWRRNKGKEQELSYKSRTGLTPPVTQPVPAVVTTVTQTEVVDETKYEYTQKKAAQKPNPHLGCNVNPNWKLKIPTKTERMPETRNERLQHMFRGTKFYNYENRDFW
jgi:hypothetical protein